MDGVHDMGGMHGFGVVPVEDDDPVFHESWEGRTFGLMIATGAAGLRSGSIRPGIEAIDPATYLASSYFERGPLGRVRAHRRRHAHVCRDRRPRRRT